MVFPSFECKRNPRPPLIRPLTRAGMAIGWLTKLLEVHRASSAWLGMRISSPSWMGMGDRQSGAEGQKGEAPAQTGTLAHGGGRGPTHDRLTVVAARDHSVRLTHRDAAKRDPEPPVAAGGLDAEDPHDPRAEKRRAGHVAAQRNGSRGAARSGTGAVDPYRPRVFQSCGASLGRPESLTGILRGAPEGWGRGFSLP